MSNEKKIRILIAALKYAIARLEQIQYQKASTEIVTELKLALELIEKS